MKYIVFILFLLASCNLTKQAVTTKAVPKPTHIQPDTCLTDKQFKQYLKFVKDSMKIENQRTKIEYKYIRDTVRISGQTKIKILREEGKIIRDTVRVKEKTKRTTIRQNEKTKRTKWYVWFIFGFISAFVIRLIFNQIKKKIFF
jgi:hypothetical protein